jgi:hypothetical protein
LATKPSSVESNDIVALSVSISPSWSPAATSSLYVARPSQSSSPPDIDLVDFTGGNKRQDSISLRLREREVRTSILITHPHIAPEVSHSSVAGALDIPHKPPRVMCVCGCGVKSGVVPGLVDCRM